MSSDDIKMVYLTQPPKKYTFEQPKVKHYVETWCKGNVLNLFAGKTKLNLFGCNEIRVDISNEFEPTVCMDAYEYVKSCEDNTFDTVILDPPYNIRKAREKYGERWIGSFTKIKNELVRIVKPNGIVITLGYDTVGMSKSRGFKKIGICVICHNGDHNDTLIVVEQKISNENNY